MEETSCLSKRIPSWFGCKQSIGALSTQEGVFDIVIADPPSFSHGDGFGGERSLWFGTEMFACAQAQWNDDHSDQPWKDVSKKTLKAIVQKLLQSKRPLRILKQYYFYRSSCCTVFSRVSLFKMLGNARIEAHENEMIQIQKKLIQKG